MLLVTRQASAMGLRALALQEALPSRQELAIKLADRMVLIANRVNQPSQPLLKELSLSKAVVPYVPQKNALQHLTVPGNLFAQCVLHSTLLWALGDERFHTAFPRYAFNPKLSFEQHPTRLFLLPSSPEEIVAGDIVQLTGDKGVGICAEEDAMILSGEKELIEFSPEDVDLAFGIRIMRVQEAMRLSLNRLSASVAHWKY